VGVEAKNSKKEGSMKTEGGGGRRGRIWIKRRNGRMRGKIFNFRARKKGGPPPWWGKALKNKEKKPRRKTNYAFEPMKLKERTTQEQKGGCDNGFKERSYEGAGGNIGKKRDNPGRETNNTCQEVGKSKGRADVKRGQSGPRGEGNGTTFREKQQTKKGGEEERGGGLAVQTKKTRPIETCLTKRGEGEPAGQKFGVVRRLVDLGARGVAKAHDRKKKKKKTH